MTLSFRYEGLGCAPIKQEFTGRDSFDRVGQFYPVTQSYTVTVTATSGTIQHSTQVIVTVN
ncbi:MAG TPA: hypothetical protein VIW93_11040 [Candidatus Acidoferrum sp.]